MSSVESYILFIYKPSGSVIYGHYIMIFLISLRGIQINHSDFRKLKYPLHIKSKRKKLIFLMIDTKTNNYYMKIESTRHTDKESFVFFLF